MKKRKPKDERRLPLLLTPFHQRIQAERELAAERKAIEDEKKRLEELAAADAKKREAALDREVDLKAFNLASAHVIGRVAQHRCGRENTGGVWQRARPGRFQERNCARDEPVASARCCLHGCLHEASRARFGHGACLCCPTLSFSVCVCRNGLREDRWLGVCTAHKQDWPVQGTRRRRRRKRGSLRTKCQRMPSSKSQSTCAQRWLICIPPARASRYSIETSSPRMSSWSVCYSGGVLIVSRTPPVVRRLRTSACHASSSPAHCIAVGTQAALHTWRLRASMTRLCWMPRWTSGRWELS